MHEVTKFNLFINEYYQKAIVNKYFVSVVVYYEGTRSFRVSLYLKNKILQPFLQIMAFSRPLKLNFWPQVL